MFIIKATAHGQRERLWLVRFLQIIQLRLQLEILAHNVGAVAAGKNNFQPGPFGPEFFRQFPAVHVIGHHEVGEQQGDFVLVLVPDLKGFDAIAGRQNFVAVFLEDARNEFPHGLLVFNEQNGFSAAANGDLCRRLFRFGLCRAHIGNVNAERRAFADGAFDLDPALVLFDNAINRRQAQAGAFADFLGGKKRLKDALEIFRRNAAAGVRLADTNEAPDTRFGMVLNVSFVHVHDGNAHGQSVRLWAWHHAH